MIVRAVLNNPLLCYNFDYFNDTKDTLNWLVGCFTNEACFVAERLKALDRAYWKRRDAEWRAKQENPMPKPEPITLEKTSRGFEYGKFLDANGTVCELQESSSASRHCIWFGVQDDESAVQPRVQVDGKWVHIPFPFPDDVPELFDTGKSYPPTPREAMTLLNSRMHLGKDDVKVLIKEFQRFQQSKPIKMREFDGHYKLNCSIRQTGDYLEIGTDNPQPQYCHQGWKDFVYPEGTIFTTHMFLSHDLVEKLLPLLKLFVKTGYLSE